MMKKLLPFLCASALALSLTACAGTINNSTADTASNVTFTFTDSGVTAAGETDTGYEIDAQRSRSRRVVPTPSPAAARTAPSR